jgi:tRNA A-37 threonylcarbamoyl transferase component Bud32
MIGQTIKHYVVEEKLGQGGMGVVYRARDTHLNRAVALKVLSREVTGDSERRRRFLREAQSAAAVTHPAIAQIYDVDEVDGVIFIAMELVEGRTVRHTVGAGDLDLLGAVDIALQVASGLAKAHEAGIVHRDIKSDNVMVTPDGHAKLLDFGLAKLVAPDPDSPASDEMVTRGVSSAPTQLGTVLGTIAYMSPEQARGRSVDQRSDIFSMGVMIYEMSTGTMPFEGTSPVDTMHAIAFDEARPVTQIRPGLPPDLQRVVSRCLRKRPEDRYQSTRDLVDDLKRLRSDTESGSIRALPIGERLRGQFDSLRLLYSGSSLWVTVAVGVLAALFVIALATDRVQIGWLIFFGAMGLLIYRRIRNRRHSLVSKVAAKLRKRAEVRLIALHQDSLTVVVDEAHPDLYPLISGMVEGINRKLYFGEPFTSRVREDVQPSELGQMLQQPGVLYVRQDVSRLARSSSASDAPAPAAGSTPPPLV